MIAQNWDNNLYPRARGKGSNEASTLSNRQTTTSVSGFGYLQIYGSRNIYDIPNIYQLHDFGLVQISQCLPGACAHWKYGIIDFILERKNLDYLYSPSRKKKKYLLKSYPKNNV
jgi:hypothetical protein